MENQERVKPDSDLHKKLLAEFKPFAEEMFDSMRAQAEATVAPLLERIAALEDRVAGLESREIKGPTNSE